MPLATNPKRTVAAWLKSDEEIAEDLRPVFLCRFLTSHQLDELYDELRDVLAIEAYDEGNARITAFLAKAVAGWRNMTEPTAEGPKLIEFAPDRFDRVLSVEEKFELANLILSRPRATELELKKSSSSAPTGAASSAAVATPPELAQKTS